jgi:hypothetical protein
MRERPSNQKVERDLSNALRRLEAGAPTNPELIRKIRRGNLRINPTTVAKEAGHSRTLVSRDNCAYPKIRAAILRHGPQRKPAKGIVETTADLRKRVAELKREVQAGREERVAILLRMKKLEDNANRGIAIAERRAAKAIKEANEVAGRRLRIVPNEFEIIELTANREMGPQPKAVNVGISPKEGRSL